jgi:peptide/nickel transport system ATP-binding protein
VDLTKLSVPELRKIQGAEIGMIFQEPMTSLNPVYTCGNQVVEAIMAHEPVSAKVAKQRAIELFKKVKLPDPLRKFNAYPHELSGGQKQRVMIAMALACQPSLIIADEPTTALDVTVQRAILEVLENLRFDHDTAVIFITHDLGVVAEIADDVVVMYKGKVVENGDALDVFDNPVHPYTKGLLACRPRLDIKMRTLPTVSDFMEVDEDGVITEKTRQSLGETLLFNFISEEEIQEHNEELAKQKPILSVQNLKTYFPIKQGLFRRTTGYYNAVDDVSFDVYKGETIGLVGESGCGKTTLGRTILRLIEPTSGDIMFDGKHINALKRKEMREIRRDMQIIFQDPYSALNPRMSIGQAIIEPMLLHKILPTYQKCKEWAIELLEKVNMQADHFYRYPHEFSGGQRQRICIARTLAVKPKLIIADESVSALDVSVQAQVLNLLNDLKEEFKLTYIFISHDLSVVKFMADRIIVMNRGKIEEIDFAHEIYEQQKTPYTRRLINAIPRGSSNDILKARQRREERNNKQ